MESEALTFYRYKCVFPKKGSPEWPALETLVLYNISIKAVDLIHLIDVRLLNLPSSHQGNQVVGGHLGRRF